MKFFTSLSIILIAMNLLDGRIATAQILTEIVVTAEPLQNNVLQLPNSVSVIDNQAIEQRNAQHLEDLLNLAPNVNFSSGASRGRFIQIRGIGERSEFQAPIINSVGLIVDGIDLTGIATAASTLDIQQVEVLRGPQGTLFGANALAGLINIVSNKPSDQPYAKISGGLQDYGGFELGGVISGPVSDLSAYRLAIKQYKSDGFSENLFLGRDNTNNIDEITARLRYFIKATDFLELDFTVFVADIDNGYDAFSLDNNRKTFSDQPGVDQQDTLAASIKANYQLNNNLRLETLFSRSRSELEYSFDEDWSHIGICRNTACESALFGFDWFYSSFDQYQRDNDNTTLDLKLVSKGGDSIAWVAGLYHRDQELELERVYTFADTDFVSRLATKNTAVYGQVDFDLAAQWSLSTGLRVERREVDYVDNLGGRATPEENLWGGRTALEYKADSGAFYYGLVARGYKAGGFNLESDISPEQREFDSETMVNYELGVKNIALDGSLTYQLALFYQDREDIQTKQSIVASLATGELGGTCPCSFTDFTDNAASGSNYGLEVELNWQANDSLSIFASAGLLKTEFDTLLSYEHVLANRDNGVPFDLNGREQAHAPSYQWVIGSSYSLDEYWSISGSIEAKDDFFFSDRHEQRSESYEMINLELGYQKDNWQLALYAKNLTDELVKTRGFGSFGNDPRKFYQVEPYNQFAVPRLLGVKASMEF